MICRRVEGKQEETEHKNITALIGNNTKKRWANLLHVNVRFETSDVVDDATRDALELACV